MNKEESNKFDKLNDTSYLLRLMLENNKFIIQPVIINEDCVYHVIKNGHTIGTIVTRHDDEINYTYNNIRLYKYFVEKFPKAKNFIMSEFWEFDDKKPIKFNTDKFDNWCKELDCYIETLDPRQSDSDNKETFNDVLNRLYELLDDYDDKCTTNTLLSDIKKVLDKNEELNKEIKNYKSKICNLFLKV